MTKAVAKVAGVMILIGVMAASPNRIENEKYSVAAIRAYLYYQQTGETSETDLLDGKEHRLWNTGLGQGEPQYPSRALWVEVELTGPTFDADEKGKLEVTVTDGEVALLNKTLVLNDWISRSNEMVIPFLVYDTGCAEVEFLIFWAN